MGSVDDTTARQFLSLSKSQSGSTQVFITSNAEALSVPATTSANFSPSSAATLSFTSQVLLGASNTSSAGNSQFLSSFTPTLSQNTSPPTPAAAPSTLNNA